MILERAAFSATPQDIRDKLRNAPGWVRSGSPAVAGNPRKPSAPKPQTVRRYLGWISGIACCGVSKPAFSHTDSQSLAEQFHPDGLRAMMQTAYRSGSPVELQWGHSGPVLSSTDRIDLTFRIDDHFGLTFDARIPDSPHGREVFDQLERGLLGVSIAYSSGTHWTVERSGFGQVRVVNGARLRHIALLKRGGNQSPAYPACYAAGERGESVGPSAKLRTLVEHRAWDELKRQACRMS